jgi:phage shock protein A
MFSLIKKLATAHRGGAREILESAVDANALRIFAQEIYECESSLKQSKHHLSGVMADKLKIKRQLDAQTNRVKQSEAKVRAKLEANDEATAIELAEEMAQQETLLNSLEKQHAKLESYEQKLLKTLKTTAQKLEHQRAELRMAQATKHAQKAVGSISQHANDYGDKFAQMQESADMIQRKQEDFDDKMLAMDEIDAQLSGEPTEREATRSQAEAIMARLKAA